MRMLRKTGEAHGLLGKGILMKRIITSAAVIVSLLTSALMPLVGTIMSASADGTAMWPLDNEYKSITTPFDPNRNNGDVSGIHNAIDIPAPYGSNIYAVCDGVCVAAGWMDAYGYMVVLQHEQQGIYTFYAHCSSMAVAQGETVTAGTVIGHVGSTGVADGDHLHYGICTNLRGGYPTITYYDPMTYFTYGEASAPVDCGCTSDYAGTYTTKGVDTYLNIRSGHSTSSTILGKILPGEEFNVVKADGNWAHIEHKGVIGCCSMEFIQKTGDIVSGITSTGVSYPEGVLKTGSAFSVKGKLTSNLSISRVWGGVYGTDGETSITTSEAKPNSLTYDLSGIDAGILFNNLSEGSYVYRIEAEDTSGQKYTVISSTFTVRNEIVRGSGDVNGDGQLTIADAVMFQSFLLGNGKFTADQITAADMDKDSKTDTFDFVLMKQQLVK